jgi:hypothetical protein
MWRSDLFSDGPRVNHGKVEWLAANESVESSGEAAFHGRFFVPVDISKIVRAAFVDKPRKIYVFITQRRLKCLILT